MDSRPISRSTLSRSPRTRSKISSAVRDWPSFPNAIRVLSVASLLEQTTEIVCGKTRDFFRLAVSQVSQFACGFDDKRRLVALAAFWHGSQERRVGFNQQAIGWSEASRGLDIKRLGEGHDAAEA